MSQQDKVVGLIRFRLEVGLAMVTSVLAAVSIVMVNKTLFTRHSFRFPVTLLSWHISFTSISLFVASRLRCFEYKHMPWRIACYFSILDCIAMGSQNLSLRSNSVSFYQMCKLLVAPVIVILEYAYFGKELPSRRVSVALVILLVGVGLASVTDVELNLLGTLFGSLATITTGMVSILCSFHQSKYELSSSQLLANVTPFEAGILLCLGPFWDYSIVHETAYIDYVWTLEALVTVFVSCLLAVLVNSATFYLIGKTSPLSYQVMGNLKTALTLGGGFMLFDKDVDLKGAMGVALAFVGCLWYAHLKNMELKRSQHSTRSANPAEPS
jgi:solute carrier family 35 protein E3